ncbi:hypothetical protein CHLRE_02g107700v5 [Chlamydomonas reinhardtii]|uniref:F-box domain-containing protein n=1 Tax=Chlamydomonas reinhardtii TaxID=3055 RepID=A0A2K3E2R0_CHLRE|nr:uncharacterized protein CHLRE_02g107700v5 [Chlamydomonas reinhardtii]PNW87071.1 hypothetical protein CHLRE_02g107700v5 [Chlamydomonas reinhardtii]
MALPGDALAIIFGSVNLRDRGACRLVCRSWRAAVDSLTVRVLELRSPVLVPALPRYQLLQQLTLSASLTSSSSDFSKALGLLPCLPHLAGLCLIFASPAAVKLPASLQALTRLTSLAVHAQPRQGPLQGLGQTGLSLVAGPTGPDGLGGDLEASAGGDGFGIAGGSGVATAEGGRALPPPRLPPVPQHLQQRPQPQHQGPVLSGAVAAAAAFAAAAASFGRQDSGGGGIGRSGVASAAAVRVAPPGLIALLLSLPYLSSVELLHVAVSATDVLSAIRHAAATASASATALGEARGAQRAPAGAPASSGVPGCCSGGLRRLVLVGSGINVMGVGAPAAALQLAQLEVLTMDSCTGADELVPLLPLLTRLKHLSLSGMDYAWAAAAGYTRRAGFNSANNLHDQGGAGGGGGLGGLGNGGLAGMLGGGGAGGIEGDEEEEEALAELEMLEAAAAAAAGDGRAAAEAEAAAGPGPHMAAAVAAAAATAAAAAAGANAAMALGPGGVDGGAGAAAGGEGDAGSRRRRLAAARRPLGFLQRLPRLCSLSLGGAFLRTLPSRELVGLTGLTALDLSGNGIDDLPYGLVSLPSLRRLDCSHNQLVALPGWVTAMQALTSLIVHHNSLERFPVLLYDMTCLQHLAIGHNRISWWPVESLMPRTPPAGLHPDAAAAAPGGAAAAPLPAEPPPAPQAQAQPHAPAARPATPLSPPPQPLCYMTSLDMSHNRLFGLPGGLAAGALGRSLRCLRLRDSLSGLDGTGAARAMALLAGVRDLRELDLSSNHLDQHCIVPLSELRSLQRLWLSDNALEELPLGLAHLSDLRLLSLRANRFTDVPVCLRWMSALEALDLSCNRLTELPAWMGGLSAAPAPAPQAPHHQQHQQQQQQQHQHQQQHWEANHTKVPHGSCMGAAGAGLGAPPGNRPGVPGGSCSAADDGWVCRCWPPEDTLPASRVDGCKQQKQEHDLDDGTLPGSAGLRRSVDAGPRAVGDAMGEGERWRQPAAAGSGPRGEAQYCEAGLEGLRWLDVSQQYAVVVRESGVPHVPPRLEVQPPHCLYGPLQGDLPTELLRLPRLRTLVLQRHPLLARSAVLRKLQARGVEVVHPRPLRIEALPGAAAAAFTTAAAAGGVLFPAAFHGRLMLPGAPGGPDAAVRSAAAAAAAAARAAAADPQQVQAAAAAAALAAMPRGLGARVSLLLLGMVMLMPLCTAGLCSALGLPPPPHVVMLVLVALAVRLALVALGMSRAAEARRRRQRAVAVAAAAAVPPMPGVGPAAGPAVGLAQQYYF